MKRIHTLLLFCNVIIWIPITSADNESTINTTASQNSAEDDADIQLRQEWDQFKEIGAQQTAQIKELQALIHIEFVQEKARTIIKECITKKDLTAIKDYLNPIMFTTAQCSPEYRLKALLCHINSGHIQSFGTWNTTAAAMLITAEIMTVILQKKLLASIPHIRSAPQSPSLILKSIQGLIAFILGVYAQNYMHIHIHNRFVTTLTHKLNQLNTSIQNKDDKLTTYSACYNQEFNN